jgi:hypothetical protein
MTRPRRAAPKRRRRLLDMNCAEALFCLVVGFTIGWAVFWFAIRPLMQVQ